MIVAGYTVARTDVSKAQQNVGVRDAKRARWEGEVEGRNILRVSGALAMGFPRGSKAQQGSAELILMWICTPRDFAARPCRSSG